MSRLLLKRIVIILVILLVPLGYLLFQNYVKAGKTISNNIQYIDSLSVEKTDTEIKEISNFEKRVRNISWKDIKAKSIYAFNPQTGRVYYERNIDEKVPIASITKLVSVMTALEVYDDSQKLKIESNPPGTENSIGLKIGDIVSYLDLYKCSLIASKNDCAEVLAQGVGYTKFIQLMNENAMKFGMNNSNFSNPSGYFNDNNYSTAFDLGKLSSIVIRNKKILEITDSSRSVIAISGKKKMINSTNVMLSENKYIKGLKTGFTYASGECLILFYDYGNNEKLITIVLDSPNRFNESREIYKKIIKEFNT